MPGMPHTPLMLITYQWNGPHAHVLAILISSLRSAPTHALYVYRYIHLRRYTVLL